MDRLVVVLTGGVASGKTQVSNEMARLGWTVIDADLVARDVVIKGSEGWHEIVERFGETVLQPDGEINRRLLREMVFHDAVALSDLNAITHPLIAQSIKTSINQSVQKYLLVVIPLLTASNKHDDYNRVLVVDVAEDIQRQRLQQRDQMSHGLVDKMLASQISRQQRLKLADDVVSNQGTLQALRHSVALLHGFYVSLVDC